MTRRALLAPLLAGCSGTATVADGPSPPVVDAAVVPSDAFDSGASTEERDAEADAAGPPHACSGSIDRAEPGGDPDAPIPADPHAEVEGADPTPRHVHVGWSGDPSTSMTVLWRTDAQTLRSRVLVEGEVAMATVDGASFLVDDSQHWPRVHEVRICGLSPGTTVRYRVDGDAGGSPVYAFTSAPPVGDAGVFVFGVSGDSRGAPETWKKVLEGMRSHGAEFVVFTGDAVNSGEDMQEWDEWFLAGAGVIESLPVVPVHGNHEYYAQPYFALHAMPGNERWYGVDYANVHFAVTDDEVPLEEEWAEQVAWLEEDLEATAATWSFVAHHEPAFSSSLTHATNPEVRAWLVPVEERQGVDIDFAGHNHHYERTVPILGDVRDDEQGVTYVITGGAGAPLYDNDASEWYTERAVVTEHYTIVRVEDRVLSLVAYDLAGNILDSWVRQK